MEVQNKQFQPGVMLHEVIVGCFRAKGFSFSGWCEANGIAISTARQATYGQMAGPRGKALLDRMITAAGPEIVEAAYRERIEREADRVKAVA